MRDVDLTRPVFEYDPDDPEGFRAGMFRFGSSMGAVATGATLYELPPGQSICPYHYEYGEEEWLLVVAGRASVRTPSGVETVEPLRMVFFPTGPEGAHQVSNDTEETVRVLMWSQVVLPTATAYPDSGKVGVYTGDSGEDLIARRTDAVDYYEGESIPGSD
jgi:uncharacterized cupin superfamily protein